MKNMINKVKIKNFQCIKNAEIELGKITVFHGKSRTGKSAFFRAFRAVTENETGDDYITWGEKETVIQVDDLKWIQSKTKNRYEIGDEVFEKCGVAVPEKVQRYLKMGEVEFGKDIKKNLNFIEQLQPIFMVQDRGSVNAKIIGSITDLGKIYNGLREAEKDTKNIKRGISDLQGVIDETREKYEGKKELFKKRENIYSEIKSIFDDVEQIKEDAQELIEKKKKFKKLNQGIDKLKIWIDKYGGMIDKLNNVDFGIADIIIAGNKFVKTKWEYRALKEKLEGYKGIKIEKGINIFKNAEMLTKAKTEVEEIKNEIEHYESVIGDFDIPFDEAFKIIDDVRLIEGKQTDIALIKNDIREKAIDYKEVKGRIKRHKKKIDEIDTCPECGAEKKHWNLKIG